MLTPGELPVGALLNCFPLMGSFTSKRRVQRNRSSKGNFTIYHLHPPDYCNVFYWVGQFMIFPPKRSNGKGDCPATPDDSFSPTLNWCLPGLVVMAITWTREREREIKNFAVLAFGLMQVLFLRGGGSQ